jgi:hypothetical protein
MNKGRKRKHTPDGVNGEANEGDEKGRKEQKRERKTNKRETRKENNKKKKKNGNGQFPTQHIRHAA